MTWRLATTDAGFDAAFDTLVDARRESDADVARDVAGSSPMCGRAAIQRLRN